MKKIFGFVLLSLLSTAPVNANIILNVAAAAVGIKASSLVPSPSFSRQSFHTNVGSFDLKVDILVMKNTSIKRLFSILALKCLVGYGAYKAVKCLLKPKQQDNSLNAPK